MTRSRLVFKNGIILTVTSIGVGFIVMWFNAFLARRLGEEAMGLFSLMMSIYTFAITLAISGVNLASTRLVAEEMAFGREKSARRSVKLCVFYSLFFSILSSIILILSANFLTTHFLLGKISARPLITLAISLPFVSISAVFNGYFNAMQQGGRSAATTIFDQFARILICTYLVAVVFAESGIENLIFAVVLGTTIGEMLSVSFRLLLYIVKKKRLNNEGNINNSLFSRLLKIAVPVGASSYLKSALTTTKQTLVPINLIKFGMVSTVALAEYGIVQGMILPLILFPTCFLFSFSQLLVPEISGLNARHYNNRIKSVISRIFKTTCVFSIFVAAIFIAYAEPLAAWIFRRPEIAPMLRVFAFCIPITYFDVIVDSLLKGLDKQVAVVNINIIDSIFTICLILTLIPKFGMLGYIILFFASEIFNAMLSIWTLLKTTACHFDFINWVAKPIIAAGIALLFHNVFLFIAVFFVILFVTKALTRKDLTI